MPLLRLCLALILLLVCPLSGWAQDEFCGAPPPGLHYCSRHPNQICDCADHNLCFSADPGSPAQPAPPLPRFDLDCPALPPSPTAPPVLLVEPRGWPVPLSLPLLACAPEPPPPRL